MACGWGQRGLSPSASPVGRRSWPPNTGDVVDRMASAVAHFGDVLGAGLVAVRGEFASRMSVVQSLCSGLDLLARGEGGWGSGGGLSRIAVGGWPRLGRRVVDLQDHDGGLNWFCFRACILSYAVVLFDAYG